MSCVLQRLDADLSPFRMFDSFVICVLFPCNSCRLLTAEVPRAHAWLASCLLANVTLASIIELESM